MNRKKHQKLPHIDFSEITPKIQIGKICFNEFYKKAFIENDKPAQSEYSRNTSAED